MGKGKPPFGITGLWLRRHQKGRIEVLCEFDGHWHLVLNEWDDGENVIGHIVEQSGIANSPVDYLETKEEGKCPNCGEAGRHFAPPSLGEPGFYTCKRKADPNAKET